MAGTALPVQRKDVPFTSGAACTMAAYTTLAKVRFDRTFLDFDAIVEAYTKGRPLAEELFGPEVWMGGPAWAGNSYGHINAVGSKLIFPEDSEVAHTPIYGSFREGIRELKKEIDFSKQGLFPAYLALWERLRRRFPEEKIGFSGFKAEGPITTAWALRGHDFFADLLENPEEAVEYLQAVLESVVRYNKMIRRINGEPEFSESGAGLADDVAAMVAPGRWPEFVMPILEQYFTAQTSGKRTAHIEDLSPSHLKYLDELKLSSFDPSVSPKLTPELVRDGCCVPFTWRLNSTHYVDRSPEQVARWVFESVAGGAASVTTVVAREMCDAVHAEKVRAFVRAGKRVKSLLDQGCLREKLVERM